MPNEDLLSEKLLQPMVQLSYAAAMDLVQARLRMINADLTEQCHRQVIRNMSCRIKTPDSVIKKLKKKGREVSFEEAVRTLLEAKTADYIYGIPSTNHPWPEFRDAISGNQDYQLTEDGDQITATLSLPGGIAINYTISMAVSGFISFYFQDLEFLADYDLNELNCRYIGVKFCREADNTVSIRYDMPVIGRIQSDLAQFFRIRNFIFGIISSIIKR